MNINFYVKTWNKLILQENSIKSEISQDGRVLLIDDRLRAMRIFEFYERRQKNDTNLFIFPRIGSCPTSTVTSFHCSGRHQINIRIESRSGTRTDAWWKDCYHFSVDVCTSSWHIAKNVNKHINASLFLLLLHTRFVRKSMRLNL